MTANPFATPEADIAEPPEAGRDDEVIRQTYLNDETRIKGVANVFLLSVLLLPVGVATLLLASLELILTGGRDGLITFVTGAAFLALTVNGVAAGWYLRKLDPRGRLFGNFQAAVGLPLVPLGTAITIYMWVILNSAAARTILTPEYREIVRRTPHIQYRTSIIVWILLGLVVGLPAVAIAWLVSV